LNARGERPEGKGKQADITIAITEPIFAGLHHSTPKATAEKSKPETHLPPQENIVSSLASTHPAEPSLFGN